MKRQVAFFSTFITAIFLTSCGPVFETHYKFSPPKSSAGYACINQCDVSRVQCLQLEDYQQRDCTDQARYEASECRDNLYRYENRKPKWYECGESSCSVNYDQCDASYRSCYETCGGNVDSETVCTSGCEELAKPAADQNTAQNDPGSAKPIIKKKKK